MKVMKRDKPIRILLADDHFVVRMGLAAVINTQPDMCVVAEAARRMLVAGRA